MSRGSRGAVLRVSPWLGEPMSAHVVAVAGPPPTVDEVVQLVEDLRNLGIRAVATNALAPSDQENWRSAGFASHEHLLLLHRRISADDRSGAGLPIRVAAGRPRSIRSRDRGDVLALDRQAFATASATWQVDIRSLVEATRATDDHRWRVVRRSPAVVGPAGHALTGRTGTTGYLQRLAVHPAAEGSGIGSALVVDALRWLARSGARDAWVNTQPGNHRARDLYERHGFRIVDDGLDVLRWTDGAEP